MEQGTRQSGGGPFEHAVPWRIGAGDGENRIDVERSDGFREIAVGKWFHMKRETDSTWHVRVGGLRIDVEVRDDGSARAHIVKTPTASVVDAAAEAPHPPTGRRARRYDAWHVVADGWAGPDRGLGFDELVMGDWFRTERNDKVSWWMGIADVCLTVRLGRRSVAMISIESQ